MSNAALTREGTQLTDVANMDPQDMPTRSLIEIAQASREYMRRLGTIAGVTTQPGTVSLQRAHGGGNGPGAGNPRHTGHALSGTGKGRPAVATRKPANNTATPKRKMTAAGRAAISRATKARWAALRAAKAGGGKKSGGKTMAAGGGR